MSDHACRYPDRDQEQRVPGGHHLWPRPRTATTTPVWIWVRCASWSRTGRRCARCTCSSSRDCPPPRAASTRTRSRAGSCRICGSMRSRLGSATASKTSKPITLLPTRFWAVWLRSPRRRRWWVIWLWRCWGPGVTAQEFAADPARYDIPDSVIGFLRGELGDPPGGWPEPLRSKALEGRAPRQARRVALR